MVRAVQVVVPIAAIYKQTLFAGVQPWRHRGDERGGDSKQDQLWLGQVCGGIYRDLILSFDNERRVR